MSERIQVYDGFCLTCTMGSGQSCISVPVSHGVSISGRNQATVTDCKAGTHISSFGTCRKTDPQKPCSPVILTPWLIDDKKYTINGEPALFTTSILSCAKGGIIRINGKP